MEMSRKTNGKSPYFTRKTRVINIPKEFLPLIMEETEEKGYFSSVFTMGVILAEHFKLEVPNYPKATDHITPSKSPPPKRTAY